MQNDTSIMKYETVLPEDFTGVFYFTNWSDEDFVGVWGSKEYLFPKLSTSPMVIPEHSPLEIQHIRKKFAKDLAEREFYRSKEYKTLQKTEGTPGNRTLNSIHQATAYSINELTPYIQKALAPLPVARATVSKVNRPNIEAKLSRNEGGELNSGAVKSDKDLEALAKGQV